MWLWRYWNVIRNTYNIARQEGFFFLAKSFLNRFFKMIRGNDSDTLLLIYCACQISTNGMLRTCYVTHAVDFRKRMESSSECQNRLSNRAVVEVHEFYHHTLAKITSYPIYWTWTALLFKAEQPENIKLCWISSVDMLSLTLQRIPAFNTSLFCRCSSKVLHRHCSRMLSKKTRVSDALASKETGSHVRIQVRRTVPEIIKVFLQLGLIWI